MAEEQDSSGGSVRFSNKELFTRLDAKLDSVLVAVSSKADQATVNDHEKRIVALETDTKSSKAAEKAASKARKAGLYSGLTAFLAAAGFIVSHIKFH